MITCPWCGTNYREFQSNCDNCGGSLPRPEAAPSTVEAERLPAPPPPPREVPNSYVGRIFMADGWTIAGGVLALLGGIFGVVGLVLTLTLVAAFVGIPFAGLGALFLLVGVPLLIWRYSEARSTVEILRTGDAVRGEIVDVYQSYHIEVNGRHPWTVAYRFRANGREYGGKVTTLSRPDLSQQPGRPVYVIHARGAPERNTIYPRLYGYYGV